MIPSQQQTQAYWDKVASKQIEIGRFNFHKLQTLTKKMLDYDLKGLNILEIGPGLGMVASSLLRPYGGFKYYVQELSEVWAEYIKKRIPCEVKVGAADKLQYEDSKFDAVFLFDVLEHIHPTLREQSYREISRVCQNSTMIFINNPIDEGEHDKNFDYGWFDTDLIQLVEILKGRIWMLETYLVPMLGRLYQFIVIIRGEIRLDRFHHNYPSWFYGKGTK